MIESINATTYRLKLKEDEVEIGDISSPDFKPHAKLKRWGEECFLCVKPVGDIEEIEFEVEQDKVKSKYKVKQNGFELELETEFYALEPRIVIANDRDSRDHEFRQNELGGFEFEIILKKKPPTNKIVLDIETQGLKFYYQPPLHPDHPTWCEDENGYSYCPDNVVGSYAVYHATKRDHIIGKTNYMCGKAFHIYRPKITDAEGNWVWGELSIDEKAGTLTTIIPQELLDSAVYPVSIDPNFGYESIGVGTFEASTDRIYGAGGTCGGDGTALSVTFYLRSGTYDDGPRKLGLYRKSDKGFEGGTAAYSGETPDDWVTHDFEEPKPTVSAQDYWVVHWGEEFSLARDASAGTHIIDDCNYPGTWPDPLVEAGGGTYGVSIFCTYEEAAPPARRIFITHT